MIADLLQQSREAHQRYREHLPRWMPRGAGMLKVPGDAQHAGLELAAACRLRAEAHALDPQRADPAWRDEPFTFAHDAILDFYVKELTR